jgi:hypothetical protein
MAVFSIGRQPEGSASEPPSYRLRVDPSRSMRAVTAEVDGLLAGSGRAEVPGVALLASELIAQVVGRDASFRGHAVELTIELRRDAVRMEASGPAAPNVRGASDPGAASDPMADWGSFIIDRLADRWGVEAGARPAIWAEIERPRHAPA